MEKWRKVASDYVFKSPFGNLRKDKLVLPDGQLIDSYYVNEYEDWVNAVVLTKDQHLVLVRQYRHAAQDFFLEVPAERQEKQMSRLERQLFERCEKKRDISPIPVLLN